MLYRLSALVAVAAFAGAALSAPQGGAGQGAAAASQAPDQVKWDLRGMNQEPFKLLKATPDAPRGQVRFLLEFTRPPTVTELFDLERGGGAFVFRFLDEDGVVLRSAVPQLEGEVVARRGARLRAVLTMPDARTLAATRSIVAEVAGRTPVITPGAAATSGTAPAAAGVPMTGAGTSAVYSSQGTVGAMPAPTAVYAAPLDRVYGGLFFGVPGVPTTGPGSPGTVTPGYSSGGSGVLPNAGRNAPGTVPGSTPPNPAPGTTGTGTAPGTSPTAPGTNAPATPPTTTPTTPTPTPGTTGTGTTPNPRPG